MLSLLLLNLPPHKHATNTARHVLCHACTAPRADSWWTYLDDNIRSARLITGFRLAPTWTYRQLLAGPTMVSAGSHTITLAEREDATMARHIELSMGNPDCQFGAPPQESNVTAASVRLELLDLETVTNNRISALSTAVDAVNSTIAAAISAYNVTLQAQMADHEGEADTARASMTSALSTANAAITAITSRLTGVSTFSTGGGVVVGPLAPVVQTSGSSGQDIALNAGSGGTVRVSGGTCQTDLCELVSQVAQLTDALRQL